jgi:uncharacterized protein YbaA (DUF1428 family)
VSYVDGFLLAVPTANRDTYKALAESAAAVFKEHGAIRVVECWGDDVPQGELTSFPLAVQCKDDETVVFSWILYNSREHRDSVNDKVMKDPRMKDMMDPKSFPFDGMRMFWGGFKSLVELSRA